MSQELRRSKLGWWGKPLGFVAVLGMFAVLAGAAGALTAKDGHEDDWEDDWDEEEYYEELGEHFVEIELYSELMGLVFDMTEIAENPTASGVAAVFAIEDHVESPEQAIEFLESVLEDVENPAIERAVRLQLSDMYSVEGNSQAALDQLRELITSEDVYDDWDEDEWDDEDEYDDDEEEEEDEDED